MGMGWVRKIPSLEEEMATHSSTLAPANLMDQGTWLAIVCGGLKESDTTE